MNTTNADSGEVEIHKALQNEYIVEHLFSFLSLNDIKNSRLVHKMWRNIGTKILRRRTRILFDFRRGMGAENVSLEVLQNKMKSVSVYCRDTPSENIPISSFAFRGEISYANLINFLLEVHSCMTELSIHCRIFNGDSSKYIRTFDFSPVISPHLTKLHLAPHLYRGDTFKFSIKCFDQIRLVKDIDLFNVTIVLDSHEKRLSPMKIAIGEHTKLLRTGVNDEVDFLVNDYFDLSATEFINLTGSNVILDFSDCANNQVERIVTLTNIKTRNWEMCDWKIKYFSLYSVDFLQKNYIEMEDLCTQKMSLDLSKIYNPLSIQKLYCGKGTEIVECYSFLPNLVNLTLGCDSSFSKLHYFTKNTKLSKMWIDNESGNFFSNSININDLPKGVDNLYLCRVKVQGDIVYPLKTLIMDKYDHINKYQTIACKFRGEQLTVYSPNMCDDENLQIVTQLLDLNDSFQRLIICVFKWREPNQFNKSAISKFVDKEAEFYVFEGEIGKGMTADEAVAKYNC